MLVDIMPIAIKSAEKAIKEACGTKCAAIFYEPEMPACLKAKKEK